MWGINLTPRGRTPAPLPRPTRLLAPHTVRWRTAVSAFTVFQNTIQPSIDLDGTAGAGGMVPPTSTRLWSVCVVTQFNRDIYDTRPAYLASFAADDQDTWLLKPCNPSDLAPVHELFRALPEVFQYTFKS